MNNRLINVKLNSLQIILDSRASCYIVLGKHTQKSRKKNTKPVCWNTQGGEFQMRYTTNVDTILPELYATKIAKWNFHVDDSQNKHRYDIILGRDILSELNIYLRLYD